MKKREKQSDKHLPHARFSSYRSSNIYSEIGEFEPSAPYYSELGPTDSVVNKNKHPNFDRPAPEIPPVPSGLPPIGTREPVSGLKNTTPDESLDTSTPPYAKLKGEQGGLLTESSTDGDSGPDNPTAKTKLDIENETQPEETPTEDDSYSRLNNPRKDWNDNKTSAIKDQDDSYGHLDHGLHSSQSSQPDGATESQPVEVPNVEEQPESPSSPVEWHDNTDLYSST